MKNRKCVTFFSSGVVLLIAWVGTPCIAAQPEATEEPAGNQSPTPQRGTIAWRHQQQQRILNTIIIDTYTEGEHRSEDWDETVLGLLRLEVEKLTTRDAGASGSERRNKYPRALVAGCKDPLIRLFAEWAGAETRGNSIGYKRLLDVLKGPDGNEFHPLLRLHSAAAVAEHAKFFRKEEIVQEAVGLIVQASADLISANAEGYERRFWLRELSHVFFKVVPIELQEEALTRLGESDEPDPWVMDVLRGRWHVDEAWRKRGSNTGPNVSAEGWRGFGGHLREANKILERAHAARPQNPEAAEELIAVAMGGYASDGHTPRSWFERARNASFEWLPAYTRYLTSLLPRWGGSHELMQVFGEECVNSERYDTWVPLFYLDVIARIGADVDDYEAILREPGYYDYVRKIALRTADETVYEPLRHVALSRLAAMAYRVDRPDDVRQAMTRVGEHFNARSAMTFKVRRPELVAMSVLASPEVGAKVKEAMGLSDANKDQESLALLEDALKECPEDDQLTREGLADLEYRVQVKLGLRGDEWVPLKFRPGLPGWRVIFGKEARTYGAKLLLSPSKEGSLLVFQEHPGERYEVKVKVNSLRFYPKYWGNGCVVYWFDEQKERTTYRSAQLYSPDSFLSLGFRLGSREQHTIESLEDDNELHVRVWDKLLSVHVNGKLVYAGFAGSNQVPFDEGRFGLGVQNTRPVGTVEFWDLYTRSLREIPEELVEFEGLSP